MQPKYTFDNTRYSVTPVRRGDVRTLEISGGEFTDRRVEARIRWLDKHQAELTVNGQVRQVYGAQDGNSLYIHLDGQAWALEIVDEFSEARSAGGGSESGQVKAPMPGVVIEVSAREGDAVTEGQVLMLIESMKLQMEIKAGQSGTLGKLGVDGPGASFNKGDILADIVPATDATGATIGAPIDSGSEPA